MNKEKNQNKQIDKEKILIKMRKIFALKRSDNLNEAENANIILKKLMIEHNINYEQIKDIKQKLELVDKEVLGQNKIPRHWKRYLVKSIALLYNCDVYLKGGKNFIFVGFDLDRKVAIQISQYLIDSISTNSVQAENKYDFCLGSSTSLVKRLDTLREKVNDTVREENALMVVKEKEVKDFIKNLDLSEGDKYSQTHNLSESYFQGEEYGKKLSLKKQITRKKSTSKLFGVKE